MDSNTKNGGKSNCKAHREPISRQQWRASLDDTTDDANGQWRLLPRQMFNSRAFAQLTYGGIIFVLAMLDKLTYESNRKRSGGRGVRSSKKLGPEVLKNNGLFTVTNNELLARGIGSESTIKNARVQAWELGFFDVRKSGSLLNCGDYKYSERWKLYPDGPYKPKGQPCPGKCLFPNKRPTESKPTTETVANALTTETVAKSPECQTAPANKITYIDKPVLLQKPQLFTNLGRGVGAGGLKGKCGRLAEVDQWGGGPKRQGGKTQGTHGGSSKRTPIPVRGKSDVEQVVNVMELRGLTHTSSEIRGNSTHLKFSDGSTITVGRYITYTDPDGKRLPDCILPKTLELRLPANSIRANVQLTDVARQVDEIMFNHGYGHSGPCEPAHGEVHMKFGSDVHAWVMVGSIMIERPGHKRLRVKTFEKLEKGLSADRASNDSAPFTPAQPRATCGPSGENDVLRVPRLKPVMDMAADRGLTCVGTQARRNGFILKFSDGSAVRISKSFFFYIGPDGESSQECLEIHELERVMPAKMDRHEQGTAI